MMNNNEKMEKLNNAGINTNKYFNIELPSGFVPGEELTITFDENGNLKIVNAKENNDEIYNQIIEDGYVRNTKLHRRWIMAQMFRNLNFESFDGYNKGYNAALKTYSYHYTLTMMLEEVRVLSKLEKRDRESFEERSHFFSPFTVARVCKDYEIKLREYVNNLPKKHCKGIPYKRIKGKNIFCSDLHKKIYTNIYNGYNRIHCIANLISQGKKTYEHLYRELKYFMHYVIKLPYDTPKSKVWIDAYKGEGAYYTLKNMCLFHDCCLIEQDGFVSRGLGAEERLQVILDEYDGEGWRMFALMKRVIEYNNFDFYTAVRENYNK